uniref:Uncharacterized protein n=1 Tax=Tetraodon nigroviridis TaxID=99883 RepID=H3DR61_TETNG
MPHEVAGALMSDPHSAGAGWERAPHTHAEPGAAGWWRPSASGFWCPWACWRTRTSAEAFPLRQRLQLLQGVHHLRGHLRRPQEHPQRHQLPEHRQRDLLRGQRGHVRPHAVPPASAPEFQLCHGCQGRRLLGVPHLEYLFIEGNRIETVSRHAFRGLRDLTHLSLANNNIKLLPRELFSDLDSLIELDCGETPSSATAAPSG